MPTRYYSALLTLILLSQFAFASPDDSLANSYGEAGTRQFDLKLGSTSQTQTPRDSAMTLGYGQNISERWFSELYVTFNRVEGSASRVDAIALVNTFLLTQGQLPFDLSLYTELERPSQREDGEQFTFGPILQTEFGLTRANLNLLFHRSYRAVSSDPMQLSYQWQLRRRVAGSLALGLQGFGDLGQWDHWADRADQSHRIGPAIFYSASKPGAGRWDANAALLFSVAGDMHSTTARAQLTYGF